MKVEAKADNAAAEVTGGMEHARHARWRRCAGGREAQRAQVEVERLQANGPRAIDRIVDAPSRGKAKKRRRSAGTLGKRTTRQAGGRGRARLNASVCQSSGDIRHDAVHHISNTQTLCAQPIQRLPILNCRCHFADGGCSRGAVVHAGGLNVRFQTDQQRFELIVVAELAAKQYADPVSVGRSDFIAERQRATAERLGDGTLACQPGRAQIDPAVKTGTQPNRAADWA